MILQQVVDWSILQKPQLAAVGNCQKHPYHLAKVEDGANYSAKAGGASGGNGSIDVDPSVTMEQQVY